MLYFYCELMIRCLLMVWYLVGVNILGANRDVRRFNTFYDDGEQINALLLNFPHFSKEAREVIEPVLQASKNAMKLDKLVI